MLAAWMIPLMNLALVVGVGAVLPSALRQPPGKWALAALGVAGALWAPAGPLAAVLVVPWVAFTVVAGVRALLERDGWLALVAGFAGTASLALLASRLEVTLFGIGEPIVKLTALHFTYAGAGTLALALRLHEVRPGRWAQAARVLVLVAPPVVAAGFVTRVALLQVGGAVVMTLGVWLVAALQLEDAKAGPQRWWWRVSSASPLVAMVLAVSWAAAQYFPQVPALSVVDMVPTHGALNAFGFVGCGHLACYLGYLRARGRAG